MVLALMLGRPAEHYLDAQRAAHLRRMHELTALKRAGSLMDTLLADYGLFHLEADLHWIDTTTARLGELAALLTRGATPGPYPRRSWQAAPLPRPD